MKTLLKLITAAVLLVPVMGNAGYEFDTPVEIDLEQQFAQGSMKSARFSDDPEAQIGCGVRWNYTADGETIWTYAFCQAAISPEIHVVCYTDNAEIVDKISRLNPWSYVQFGWQEGLFFDEPETVCTRFGFSTQSGHLPNVDLRKVKADK